MKLLWAVVLMAGLTVVAGAEEKTLGSYAGEVTASRLQLRAGPGEAYQPVATLKRGALVVVIEQSSASQWLTVEVPQGYHAWVFGAFMAAKKDGTGMVTTDRLLVRPSATTRYHQLNGRLKKGETVKIVAKKQTKEGLWYKVVVPRRFPLYAHARFLKNVGPAKLAEPKQGAKPAEAEKDGESTNDRQFQSLIKAILLELPKVKSTDAIQPLRRAVMQVDPKLLSLNNRSKRIEVLSKILHQERQLAIKELTRREREINDELKKKLAEIEARYQEKLRKLRVGKKPARPRFVATGIVEYAPDLFGRHPSFRLAKGKKMRFFLIATDYNLQKFIGKRVGVTGLTDPESGTGYRTIMVGRIEILGDK